jgi:hypothetical protein
MDLLKVTRAHPGDSVSGKVTFTAKRGQFVQFDPATLAGKPQSFHPDVAFKLADGTRGFVLERDIINGPVPLDQILFLKNLLPPDTLSPDGLGGYFGWVSARKIEEAEFEGSNLIDASITGSTAAGTDLGLKAGKIATLVAAGGESIGRLRGQLAPQDPDNNTIRIVVEFIQ